MSPGHSLLARGRAVLDATLYTAWAIEGGPPAYVGQFMGRHETNLQTGGFAPEASASLVVSQAAVGASGIAIGKRIIVNGRTYVVSSDDPQPMATIFYLSDPQT